MGRDGSRARVTMMQATLVTHVDGILVRNVVIEHAADASRQQVHNPLSDRGMRQLLQRRSLSA
jgi:hypothetical protein